MLKNAQKILFLELNYHFNKKSLFMQHNCICNVLYINSKFVQNLTETGRANVTSYSLQGQIQHFFLF